MDCRKPFSFYFELIAPYWKATTNANMAPIHRACTLARKQGADYLLIESALTRTDVREEIDDLDASNESGGAAEAVSITFFRSQVSPDKIDAIDPRGVIGQFTIINYRAPGSPQYTCSYLYEAIFSAPSLDSGSGTRKGLLNYFICSDGQFDLTAGGRTFQIRGVYYGQQNTRTSVCAHACLRMALNSIGSATTAITTRQINNLLNIKPPYNGLTLPQLTEITKELSGVRTVVYNCKKLQHRIDYLTILSSLVESGNLALLVFTTPGAEEHVVTVFGHTRNNDEWHPQALPAYSGPKSARYFPSSAWVDHLLIHDDNFGPYFALSTRAFEVDSSVEPHWIIGLERFVPNATAATAETKAAILLTNLLPSLATVRTGKWFEYVTRTQWEYVLRAITISRDSYLKHLKETIGHDGSKTSTADLARLASLPEFFWMVEFSLPDLYTGNRAKLGEVLLDATTVDAPEVVPLLAIRLPGLLVVTDKEIETKSFPIDLTAHSPIYSVKEHDHHW